MTEQATTRRRTRKIEVRPHLTPQERAALGRRARSTVPRSSHAVYDPGPSRPDPVALLESQSAARVPELVPIRYGRMAVSPFTFYRGAALVMASDLSGTPLSGLVVQLCGDAHLSNFGAFGSPERRLLFDLNDFDETLPGPWEWDVKRLAASIEIAGRDNGLATKERRTVVQACVASYRRAMRDFAGRRHLDVWYARADLAQLQAQLGSRLRPRGRRRLSQEMAKARTRDNVQAMAKLTAEADGGPRIIADPPLIVPVTDLFPGEAERSRLESQIYGLLDGYRRSLQHDRRALVEQYRPVDLARKVVGVGSVGTRCWIVLMLGRDEQDPLFLQVKEAVPAVLEGFLGAGGFDNAGHRVVTGQRLMQAASDIFLGWQRIDGPDGKTRDYYVRQLRDWKLSVEIGEMLPAGLRTYGELCGWTLARAHARTGDRIAIAAYLGSGDAFDRAVATFSQAYADQNDRDHGRFVDAIKDGRITAQSDL
ncbi:DUF2252 domain-containing protein [Pseudonocardia bannensis]|uniref:DUF2252 domain-containing protein n=1 Tax=Pseudonocardia bannensis TaxID=630973 RepID=A0A848DIJ2_9PSEU|nr:DUF2252 domain-containing protein [Pseudonocardia bannensis]NMH92274.1 DUF2252 domain-containing protein [Pseudonocardia bannensis]